MWKRRKPQPSIKLLERTHCRLQLLCLLFRPGNSPTLRLSHCRVVCVNTLYPVETRTGPSKRISGYKQCPVIQHPSAAESHPLTCRVPPSSIEIFMHCTFHLNPFWWTRRESNPRPRYVSVCFIQPYINTLPKS